MAVNRFCCTCDSEGSYLVIAVTHKYMCVYVCVHIHICTVELGYNDVKWTK